MLYETSKNNIQKSQMLVIISLKGRKNNTLNISWNNYRDMKKFADEWVFEHVSDSDKILQKEKALNINVNTLKSEKYSERET